MKLFSHHAENVLFEKAKSLSAQHDSWRCLYINFSGNKEQYSDGLRTHVVTSIIKELLEGEEGYIYLCQDGDVFILFQGKAAPILDKIGQQFKELGGYGRESLYTVLDLSTHWQVFFALCRNKAAAVTPEASKPAMQAAPPTAKAVLPEMDAQLFHAVQRHARKQLRVLVVEDDPFTRRLVASTLKGDFDIVEAGDAAEALHVYGSAAPDAVFLDIELPDFNGHVVLSKLLAFDPSAFVVMLSANSVKENILAALEKGAKGFVTKPFAKEKLMHYLHLCEAARRGAPLKKGPPVWA